MKSINEHAEFRAVSDPLHNIEKEIRQNKKGLDEIRVQLSQKDEPVTGNAWGAYLSSEDPNAHVKCEDLRQGAARIEDRQRFLESALNQGRAEVEKIRGRLSMELCKQARSLQIAEIKRVFTALREIADACAKMRAIRDDIEKAGYRSSSLRLGEFKLDGVDGYKKYIREGYPELEHEI